MMRCLYGRRLTACLAGIQSRYQSLRDRLVNDVGCSLRDLFTLSVPGSPRFVQFQPSLFVYGCPFLLFDLNAFLAVRAWLSATYIE